MTKQQTQFRISDEKIPYTGRELRSHFILEKTGIYGPAILGFRGPCHVKTTELVDLEDQLAGDFIQAQEMFHFIGEFFQTSLETTVFSQRLFMSLAAQLLMANGVQVERSGDDLYCTQVPQKKDAMQKYKLSVSIATASSVSTLVHWGINIDAQGAPETVKACGLKDWSWSDAQILDFAKKLLSQYSQELDDIQFAQYKVRAV